jgi:hypothetical protein
MIKIIVNIRIFYVCNIFSRKMHNINLIRLIRCAQINVNLDRRLNISYHIISYHISYQYLFEIIPFESDLKKGDPLLPLLFIFIL